MIGHKTSLNRLKIYKVSFLIVMIQNNRKLENSQYVKIKQNTHWTINGSKKSKGNNTLKQTKMEIQHMKII